MFFHKNCWSFLIYYYKFSINSIIIFVKFYLINNNFYIKKYINDLFCKKKFYRNFSIYKKEILTNKINENLLI